MTKPLLFTLNGHARVVEALCREAGMEEGSFELRHFPDGESYVRVLADVADRDTVILCGLDRPDGRFLPLWFLASALREAGARSVGLVAPYLAYMRQDKRFHEGEGVTSRYFAGLLSVQFDWLATVDPHLHRYHSLGEIYSIPSRVVHAAPLLSSHLADRNDIFLVGPDEESEQWVSGLGEEAGVPWVTARKQRHGDRDVVISLPDLSAVHGRHAVLVDDVISSGATMERTLEALAGEAVRVSACLCVHGLFVDGADRRLLAAGAGELVSANTISHDSNDIDVGPLLAAAVVDLVGA